MGLIVVPSVDDELGDSDDEGDIEEEEDVASVDVTALESDTLVDVGAVGALVSVTEEVEVVCG